MPSSSKSIRSFQHICSSRMKRRQKKKKMLYSCLYFTICYQVNIAIEKKTLFQAYNRMPYLTARFQNYSHIFQLHTGNQADGNEEMN